MNSPDVYLQLASSGFERITHWELHGDRIKPHSLVWADSSGWIYAFVAEGRVRYVGITTTVLRSRLDGYSHQVGDRVRASIRSCLSEKREVEIFGARRPNVEKADLETEESRLIKEFKTDWNVRE